MGGSRKVVKTVRLDELLDRRLKTYCETGGIREADAIRKLLEVGLSSEGLCVFASPVGELIRSVIEAEMALMRQELEEHERLMEERVARVVARGSKASLAGAAQLNDLARSLIPAWRETPAEDLWKHYQGVGGALLAGGRYADVRKG